MTSRLGCSSSRWPSRRYMIDPQRARQTLEKLSALGLRISLDDFGVGYNSLSQLKACPSVRSRSTARRHDETRDRSDSLIVASINSLGHNLGLTLVAEGVENRGHPERAGRYGCDVARAITQWAHPCRCLRRLEVFNLLSVAWPAATFGCRP